VAETKEEVAFHPSEKDLSKNELYCHRDSVRQCGPDCMAFLSEVPDGKDYAGQPWARCIELVSAHKSAKHLTILTTRVDEYIRRTGQLPIPKVG
jgi:hypothetical protein